MISHVTYKVIHLAGIFLLFTGLGGLWALGSSSSERLRQRVRRGGLRPRLRVCAPLRLRPRREPVVRLVGALGL